MLALGIKVLVVGRWELQGWASGGEIPRFSLFWTQLVPALSVVDSLENTGSPSATVGTSGKTYLRQVRANRRSEGGAEIKTCVLRIISAWQFGRVEDCECLFTKRF